MSSSFPDSPAPALSPTPNPLPRYTMDYTPVDRDYALDYEACMIAIGDLNRMGRVIFGNRTRIGQVGDLQVPTSREDVIPIILELREALNRLYQRLTQHS